MQDTLLLLAEVAASQGREADAEQTLRRVLAGRQISDSVEAARIHARLAHCAWRLGRLDEADDTYQRVLMELRQKLPDTSRMLMSVERAYAHFLIVRVDSQAAA